MKVFKQVCMVAAVIGISAMTVHGAQFGVCTHMGLNNNYSNKTNVETAEKVNAGWVRDECRWQFMQTSYDTPLKIRDKDLEYIKKTDEAGINQLLILAFGNTNYDKLKDSNFPTQEDSTYYNGFLDYVRYTVSTVGEYVDAYELWNEPNIEGFNYGLQASGTDYAKLYLDVNKIIDELDPGATLLCGSITGAGETDLGYAQAIFDYIKTQGDVNSLIDAFSIHIYTNNLENGYVPALGKWEKLFDSYGFDGDVWMTENGVSSNTDNNTQAEQAAYIARVGLQWENYLKENNRSGVNFWYDLRDDGQDPANYEHRLGLVDYMYNPKPAFFAMKAYNDLTGGKILDEITEVKTQNNIFSSDEYGYLAKFSDDEETVYIAYDMNENSGTINVPLSGDIAWVYDYLGNEIEEIQNPSGTKAIDPKTEAVYVKCKDCIVSIDSAVYNEDNNVVEVSGSYNNGDEVTIELLLNRNVVLERKAEVKDGKFNMWFSYTQPGEYVIRAGKPEYEKIGMSAGWVEKSIGISGLQRPSFDVETNVSYDVQTKKVSMTGKITNYEDEQLVTVMAVPDSMDIENVDFEALAYIGQVPVTDGSFSLEFDVPEYFETKMAIYLGGTGIGQVTEKKAYIEEGKYVYVASLDITKGDSLSSSAVIKNFTETDKKASIIIAQYDNAGRLLKMEVSEKSIPAKTYKAVEYSLKDVLIETDAKKAKAFIVSDLTGFVPLSELEEKDI